MNIINYLYLDLDLSSCPSLISRLIPILSKTCSLSLRKTLGNISMTSNSTPLFLVLFIMVISYVPIALSSLYFSLIFFFSVLKYSNQSSPPDYPFRLPSSLPSNFFIFPLTKFLLLLLNLILFLFLVQMEFQLTFSINVAFLYFFIFILFRQFLDKGVFLSVWRTSSITPVFKSNYPYIVSNYRLISIFPHIVKLFESIVYNIMTQPKSYYYLSAE